MLPSEPCVAARPATLLVTLSFSVAANVVVPLSAIVPVPVVFEVIAMPAVVAAAVAPRLLVIAVARFSSEFVLSPLAPR